MMSWTDQEMCLSVLARLYARVRRVGSDRLEPLERAVLDAARRTCNAADGVAERARRWRPPASAELMRRTTVAAGGGCSYCLDEMTLEQGSPKEATIDHLVPRCKGGTDDPANLVIACRSCNSRKGGRTPEQAGMRLMASL